MIVTSKRCNIGFICLLVAASQLITVYAQISRELCIIDL